MVTMKYIIQGVSICPVKLTGSILEISNPVMGQCERQKNITPSQMGAISAAESATHRNILLE